jgi:hypothetical protein
MSPFFYNVFSRSIKPETDDFSQYLIDNFWSQGWTFYEYWKVRILLFLCISLVVILQFVEVTSFMLQELIIHSLISGIVVDYINNYAIKLSQAQLSEDKPKVRKYDDILILESYYDISKDNTDSSKDNTDSSKDNKDSSKNITKDNKDITKNITKDNKDITKNITKDNKDIIKNITKNISENKRIKSMDISNKLQTYLEIIEDYKKET